MTTYFCSNDKLHNYQTGAELRRATTTELEASLQSQLRDGGAGVISHDDLDGLVTIELSAERFESASDYDAWAAYVQHELEERYPHVSVRVETDYAECRADVVHTTTGDSDLTDEIAELIDDELRERYAADFSDFDARDLEDACFA